MTVVLMAAGGITNDVAALPLPEELPTNTVAVVSHVPLDLGTITKREFQHALVLSAASIATSPREVAFELAQVKESNFKSEAEWHRFIRESHFTRHDLNERVELQILSTKIQERIVGSVRSKSGQQRAFKQFVDAYKLERFAPRNTR